MNSVAFSCSHRPRFVFHNSSTSHLHSKFGSPKGCVVFLQVSFHNPGKLPCPRSHEHLKCSKHLVKPVTSPTTCKMHINTESAAGGCFCWCLPNTVTCNTALQQVHTNQVVGFTSPNKYILLQGYVCPCTTSTPVTLCCETCTDA